MSDTTDPRGRSAAEIENDVENTRARVADTIVALRDSMSPNQIMDQVVDYARSSGGSEFIRNLGSSVRDNPLPVLLIGAGIGWMLMSGQNQNRTTGYPADAVPDPRLRALPAPSPSSYPQRPAYAGSVSNVGPSGPGVMERVGNAASGVKDAVTGAVSGAVDAVTGAASSAGAAIGSAASSVADGASRLGDQASSTAGSLHDAARRQGHDATHALGQGYGAAAQSASQAGSSLQHGWSRMSQEQPLLVGALGLAVGAALGALLPKTAAEDRLMGEASDSMSRQLGETVESQYEQAKEVVTEHAGQVKEALSGAYEDARQKVDQDGLSAQTIGDSVKNAASRVAEVANQASDNLAESAKAATQTAPDDVRDAGRDASRATSGFSERPQGFGQPNPPPARTEGLKTPTIVVPPKV